MKNIIFDLDGTLTDSEEGITKSVEYALKHFDIPVESRKSLRKFIGPPLKDSFMNFYGFSDEKAEKAIGIYREYFKDKGLFENKPYGGIKELLEKLENNLYIATSKPEVFAVEILEHFGFAKYFKDITGATLDGKFVEKDDIIEKVVTDHQLQRDNTVMIGDRSHDIYGAKKNHLSSIGVLYGYGSQKELEEAGADRIVHTVEELEKLLLEEVE
ncbi:MAG: HAD family hydrolase [Tissierellia bacterium]|nr:HAD family hydrolase [Tissierellia bacterium]